MEALRAILASLPQCAATEVDDDTRLALAWAVAGGPRLAPRARCRELRAGVLYLEITADANGGTRRQLESVRGELLAGLQRTLGRDRIQNLQID